MSASQPKIQEIIECGFYFDNFVTNLKEKRNSISLNSEKYFTDLLGKMLM